MRLLTTAALYLAIWLGFTCFGYGQKGNSSTEITLNIEQDTTQPIITFGSVEPGGNLKVQVVDQGGIDTVWIDRYFRLAHQQDTFEVMIAAASEHIIRAVDRRGNIAERIYPSTRGGEATKIPEISSKKSITQTRYYALIIGVEDYSSTDFTSLKYPVDNARALREILTEQYQFLPSNITMLEDSTATRQSIERALNQLRQTVGENSSVLIFFAGHGHWEESSQTGFWIPHGAIKGDRSTYVRISAVQDYISEINSQHTLLLVDACYSGSIFQSRGAGLEGVTKDIQLLYAEKSRAALTSSVLNKVPDKSVFFQYLLKELNDNTSRYLPARTLFHGFRDKVIKNSQKYGITPQYEPIPDSGHEFGEFIFTKSQ